MLDRQSTGVYNEEKDKQDSLTPISPVPQPEALLILGFTVIGRA